MTNGIDTPEDARASAAKSIILFSDGTGNSSAKLFKTNVWRMYEAVDLGPAAAGKRDQISYYDDGVGTSSFKPISLLGGAFGWGLRRNVLDIYRYACRNYREGDDIYAFGFSRGAFTVRLVVALIASEGLVSSTSEAELDRKSRKAYRAFRYTFLPRRLQWPTKWFRKIHGWVDRLSGNGYDPAENCRPDIRFVGVWDTVSAYGGPITEITRAIDNWLYPLSMPNYQLNERVLCARHALAIDDERDAFQPLLWDEVHEEALIKEKKVDPRRLEQVWFTGMHADVGGGYPDESLSYVSLLWMMEEAELAGLRTLKVVKDRFVALASSYGPLHDSRAGLAAYYRYQPRKISAWLDPVDEKTLSLRDPAIRDSRRRSRGLLRSVNVHESVINRIATGTDRYAPITLPQSFNIVPPQIEGETAPQEDNQTSGLPLTTNTPKAMVGRELRARLINRAPAEARARVTEPIWNFVWWRRLTYFATLTATLLLLMLPFYVARLPSPPVLADGRTWIGGIIRLLTLVLPGFAGEWVEVYADNPFYFFLLGGIVLLFLKAGTRVERKLRDEARQIWRAATENGPQPDPRESWIQKVRNSRRYQRFVQVFKWYVLPDWVFAPLFVVTIFWLALAVYAQAALPFLENGTSLCRPSVNGLGDITRAARDFSTRDVCSESFGLVEETQRYVVTFDVVDPWYDSAFATSPEGIGVGDFTWGLGYAAGPFRRVIDARYLQPVLEVRPTDKHKWFAKNTQIYPLLASPVGDSVTLYRAEFTAPRSGELFLFANDAMIPLRGAVWGKYDYRYFYERSGFGGEHERGNRGTACVTVERVSIAEPPIGAPRAGSICERAAARHAAQAAQLKIADGASAQVAGRTDPPSTTYGPTPTLAPPIVSDPPRTSFPTVIGWKPGETPQAPFGFRVTLFAGNLDNPRWLHVLPNGDVLVAESRTEKLGGELPPPLLEGLKRSGVLGKSANRMTLLRDADRDGRAEVREPFAEDLNLPFGIWLLAEHLYVANTDAVVRFRYRAGDRRLSGPPEKVLDLPAGGYNNHWTRNIIARPDGSKIYVSVGSQTNVDEEKLDVKEPRRAAILEANPDGSAMRVFANGLRNPNGMDWAPGTTTLWTVVNERDLLGDDLVPDYLTSVRDGAFYGWPYSYYGQHQDPRHKGARPDLVAKAVAPDYALGPHTASLGLRFYRGTAFPPEWRGAFIGQHGSWNRSSLSGYKVIHIPFTAGRPSGAPQDFLTGFIASPTSVRGRPVGLTELPDGSLLVADDAGNSIWRVAKIN